MRKRFLAGVLSLCFAVNAVGAYAEIEGVDFGSLGRLYRKWFTPYAQQADAPPCNTCGSITVRNGSCYACRNCGSTTGCS